jgi:2,5-diamino-6-(ribosylamino)-4(3H)-pyrimidinone 5'-phosphate reductase
MSHPKPRDTLLFPPECRDAIDRYLPVPGTAPSTRPFVTLTFATSLDSALSLTPGTQTALSGPQSKAMTHYLRSRHDAIVIGVGTAIADDPSLNCRLDGVGGYGGEGLNNQPTPVVIDPSARWDVSKAKCLQLAMKGQGRPPWIVTTCDPEPQRREALQAVGGRYIILSTIGSDDRLEWKAILDALSAQGVQSAMIEGGGGVVNCLLASENKNLVDSVIITIAPVWLGQGGVVVSPPRVEEGGKAVPAARLQQLNWQSLGEDVVLCGRLISI